MRRYFDILHFHPSQIALLNWIFLIPAQPNNAESKDKELKQGKTAEESLLSDSQPGQKTRSAQSRKKTMAELDEDLRLKLEGVSGEGGSAGIEYEGGKAEGLKRGVKANMFRVI